MYKYPTSKRLRQGPLLKRGIVEGQLPSLGFSPRLLQPVESFKSCKQDVTWQNDQTLREDMLLSHTTSQILLVSICSTTSQAQQGGLPGPKR